MIEQWEPADERHCDEFFDAFIEAAEFADFADGDDEDGIDMPEKGSIWSEEAMELLMNDCIDFLRGYGHMIPDNMVTHAGHDFWFTRQGHGVGFWDGDWDHLDYQGTPVGDILTAASKTYGSVDLFIGLDDMVYC